MHALPVSPTYQAGQITADQIDHVFNNVIVIIGFCRVVCSLNWYEVDEVCTRTTLCPLARAGQLYPVLIVDGINSVVLYIS